MDPLLVVNFKAYSQGIGTKSLEIAHACQEISERSNVEIILTPQPTDIHVLHKNVDLPIYAQHVDPITPGSNTGSLLPESVKNRGAEGTLLNHSERNLLLSEIDTAIKRCNNLDLKTIVCASNIEIARACSYLNPDYVAIEPPELIGGDVSVTSADPDIVKNSVNASNVPVLCGAGVSSGEDFKKALELGADGVLVASSIVKSQNPKKAIKELINKIR